MKIVQLLTSSLAAQVICLTLPDTNERDFFLFFLWVCLYLWKPRMLCPPTSIYKFFCRTKGICLVRHSEIRSHMFVWFYRKSSELDLHSSQCFHLWGGWTSRNLTEINDGMPQRSLPLPIPTRQQKNCYHGSSLTIKD